VFQLITGISAAAAHVLSGPDHLAAVTPLAIETKKKSWGVGLAWGIGHTLGVLIIGVLFLLFRDVIPVEAISAHSELLVGVMLILIGLWAIVKTYVKHTPKKHAHPHLHPDREGGFVHIHHHHHDEQHWHDAQDAHRHRHDKTYRQNVVAAFGVGVFHGLAGVSHILAILPTLALPTRFDAVMYLTGFGLGTIGAMVLYAVVLGFVAIKASEQKKRKAYASLRIGGGVVAIVIWIAWIVMAA
jgi:ABC-type nickel/cobalt efflux system permease component RcnA